MHRFAIDPVVALRVATWMSVSTSAAMLGLILVEVL